ncbi:MAG: hypothetical protein Q7T92_07520 [Lutibacter sp.]|nr:hypothetical protein [Lutibacter sp.]
MDTINKALRIFLIFAALILYNGCSANERNYQAGDALNALLAGLRYSSTVLEVKPELYKIHHNNQINIFDRWIADDQIRPGELNTSQNTIEQETVISKKIEEINEGLPVIIGTSWSLLCIYEKGTQPKYLRNFPEYLFCNNGRWELHSLTTSAGQMGTYKIKGNRLIIVHDGVDKLTGNYAITWNDTEKYLELSDGKLIFRLRYRTKTKC